jgi:hypothetical protein
MAGAPGARLARSTSVRMKCKSKGVAMGLFLISACGGTSASHEEAGLAESGPKAADAAGSTDGAGSGDSSRVQDNAPSDVSTSEEDGRRAAPIDAATGDGPIDAASGDDGNGSSCQTNADCAPNLVCYAGYALRCGDRSGVCVSHLTVPCMQSTGGGCPCLDVPAGTCSSPQGDYCKGKDVPSQCWICTLPL